MRKSLAVVIGIVALSLASACAFAAPKATHPVKPGASMKAGDHGSKGGSCPVMATAGKSKAVAKKADSSCGGGVCPVPHAGKSAVKKSGMAGCPMMGGAAHKVPKTPAKVVKHVTKKK